jgi:hypothetical protein
MKSIQNLIIIRQIVEKLMRHRQIHRLILQTYIFCNHVNWVPCHHGMARPQVADGGEGLQIWRVAVNILNK